MTTNDGPYRGKRFADLVILCAAALPAMAIGAACAAAVACTSRGPALFRQERVGKDGELFICLKFRTMADGDNPIIPDASVITGVGRFLRRVSLDELPQLVNVARGEMSIVGPRPTLEYQTERYTEHQRRRLAVRPGLTGLAQVNGRNAISWDERIEHDVAYVEQQSLRVDFDILRKTLRAVAGGEGVEGHAIDDPLSAPTPEPALPSGLTPEARPLDG